MEKNVLLISDGGGFMIEALANNLKKIAGFGITKASPAVEDIKDNIGGADVILLYSGE